MAGDVIIKADLFKDNKTNETNTLWRIKLQKHSAR
jgi:hypothetical protein